MPAPSAIAAFVCPRCGLAASESFKRPGVCKACSIAADMPAPVPAPPPARPPRAPRPAPRPPTPEDAIRALDARLAALAELGYATRPARARGVWRRWLQLRWQRVALLRAVAR
jgi:hypothetical protein